MNKELQNHLVNQQTTNVRMTLSMITRFESPVINLIGGLAPLYEGREKGESGSAEKS